MRAYRKTTTHPVCLYWTDAEARKLLEECEGVDPDLTPELAKVVARIASVVKGRLPKAAD